MGHDAHSSAYGDHIGPGLFSQSRGYQGILDRNSPREKIIPIHTKKNRETFSDRTPNGLDDLDSQVGSLFPGPSVSISPVIGQRRKKRADQVTMGSMDHNAVKSGSLHPVRSLRKCLHQFPNLCFAKVVRTGQIPPESGLINLADGRRTIFFNAGRQVFKLRNKAVMENAQPMEEHLVIHIHGFHYDGPHPSLGSLDVVVYQALGDFALAICKASHHGSHDHSVFQGQFGHFPPNAQRLEKDRKIVRHGKSS
jgi:hypothetical protein